MAPFSIFLYSFQFDRYMLHHQEEDSIGELKEQLFKVSC